MIFFVDDIVSEIFFREENRSVFSDVGGERKGGGTPRTDKEDGGLASGIGVTQTMGRVVEMTIGLLQARLEVLLQRLASSPGSPIAGGQAAPRSVGNPARAVLRSQASAVSKLA